jgi:hypothetical protein
MVWDSSKFGVHPFFLKATAIWSRMAWSAGKIPAIIPNPRTAPQPMNMYRTGK